MMLLSCLAAAGIASAALTTTVKNVISFGDSYTDQGRLAAYSSNGTAPAPGTDTSSSNYTASGGYAWGHFATEALGAKYYDYAVSGAFCTNEIFSRFLSGINRTFPAVLDDEIPGFLGDISYVNASTGTNTFYTDRESNNTIYTLWIGTNDLGWGAFLTDSQHAGLTIDDYINCHWDVFDAIYETGGRNFVLFNQAPLELSPIYKSIPNGGVGDNHYWANKTAYNTTDLEQKMLEYTTLVNTIYDYGVPFQGIVKARYPGANWAIFDVHQLLKDIYYNPQNYLEAPANVTGFYRQCDLTGATCVNSEEPLHSFLWFDELHPSEAADEVIGLEFANVVRGNSTYATYY